MQLAASDLDVLTTGHGPRVVFVHGSVVGAGPSWRHQAPLAERFTLCMPNRPGFASSPPLERGDFEREAPLIAELLADGSHLVGHSYGAVIALLAAALRPHAVHSLAVSEPGSLRVAAGHSAVDEIIAGGSELYRQRDRFAPADFLRLFRGDIQDEHDTPRRLSDELLAGARMLKDERPAWEAELPLAELRRAAFPKLVISGGHSEVFDAVCDAIAQGIGAERAVIPGRDHAIPATGEAYNTRLAAFIDAAEAAQAANPPKTTG